MKHVRFEENILADESYTSFGRIDKKADNKKSQGIATNFADKFVSGETQKWYQKVTEEPNTFEKVTDEEAATLKTEAASLLHGDTLAYENKMNRSGSSDQQWARTLMSKGAIGDRVAAATILIQDNPLYNLSAIRNLVNSVKPAKKKDGIVVIDALSELFISDLLNPDHKLRTFESHALSCLGQMSSGNNDSRKKILKYWYFEDQLRELYTAYVEALNAFAHDSVDANKEKSVSAMSYLLMHHPEKEKLLLTNIINKLGDPSQTVASKVVHHMCQILYNHPNMKNVVLNEIEKMLFRTNISSRAQYYGICFLNQFYLAKEDSRIAENLIKIYFAFFKASIKKGEIDTRLMSAILTGVKRAYPFTDNERLSNDAPKHIDAIHRLVHLGQFNIAIHSLALLYHVSNASTGLADRFYSSLYRKLTNAQIFDTTHSALLFSLIYKSLKNDSNVARTATFVRRLLQLCLYMTPAQACGILFLVSQVVMSKDKRDVIVKNWFDVKEELKEEIPKIDNVPKIDEEVEKMDEEDKNAEITEKDENKKDEVTTIDENSADVIKTGKKMQEETKKNVKIDLLHGTKQDLFNDDSDGETYVDVKLDENGKPKPTKKKKGDQKKTGWFHAAIKTEDKTTEVVGEETKERDIFDKIAHNRAMNMNKVITKYDPSARNPAYAGADTSIFCELFLLANHYHPTVKLFAEKLISGCMVQYTGDPLKDFSGIRFLDRFAFKNPRTKPSHDVEGGEGEVKKVKGSHPVFAKRSNYVPKGLKSLPVTSDNYLNKDVTKVPVDELFLYDYLQTRNAAKKELDEGHDDNSDADSINSDDFDRYLDEITGISKEDNNDEHLDFMSEMKESTKNNISSQKKKKQEEPEDDDDDESLGGDENESDIGDEDEDEFEFGGSDEEDELALEGSDGDDDGMMSSAPPKGLKKGKKNAGMSSIFASAEEFAELLEDNANNAKQGSSQAMANTDNSNIKQLSWEENRDRWVKGYNRNAPAGSRNKFQKMGNSGGEQGKFGKRKASSFGGKGGKKSKMY